MKRYLQTLAFFVLMMTFLPLILSSAMNRSAESAISQESEKMTEESLELSKPTVTEPDDEFTVFVTSTGETLTLDLELLTARVLYAEMPASFEFEALKAQAVVIRSYIIYSSIHPQDNNPHPNADICTDYTHCVAYRTYEDAVEAYGVVTADDTYCVMLEAVAATKGEYITYDSEPINAVHHGASVGRTESCKNIWGADIPYLQSVETPEAADEFKEKKSFLPSELKILLEPLNVEFTYNPSDWVGEITRNSSGRVDTIDICGTLVSGKQLRSLLSLRSTDLQIEFVNGYFIVTTVGYGHGVGFSQYGADLLAKNGADYYTILAHYYPSTAVVSPAASIMSPTA